MKGRFKRTWFFDQVLFSLFYAIIEGMITIFHSDKLTRQPFFQDLINYLDQHDHVILREIKKAFPNVTGIDKAIESYVQAGYIRRENKRYGINLPLVSSDQQLALDTMLFVDTCSAMYENILAVVFETQLTNQTNHVMIKEKTNITRDDLTLANYFYRLKRGEKPSAEQMDLYDLLGDVNQEYALKYMTTFLLKFTRKDLVMQKRPDIFVEALVTLGYLKQVEPTTYQLLMTLDKESLTFIAP
ncbi:putative cytoplasmic protein [Streptococcus pyogenes]|nr:putative cytoplasmic protein [Streptococcus pyogenes]VGX64265.1 putative cytoplasmic protein [Streptococcus pyogenes]VGY03419.1 putative cytoplasmic protein [Streptococcus pyogenes]VGY21269.1 putative cytoplasmic protein [Streptococcus pyogenes]VGY41841.1 putative cytoplasmic protein [Streptococcus pyogenes]